MRKLAKYGLGTFAVLCVGMTAAHLPPFSGWLGWQHHAGQPGQHCPFGYDKAPEERTAMKAEAKAQKAAAKAATPDMPIAKARPALGFSLGSTTKSEILEWATGHAVMCSERHHGMQLECTNAPVDGAVVATSVWFELDDTEVLQAVKTIRHGDLASIAAAFDDAKAKTTAAVGAPTKTHGEANSIDQGQLRQAVAEYTYGDYRATLRATHNKDEFILTENYQAL